MPAPRAVFPALAGQFVLIMLGSSVVSTISAEELTATANAIQTETFRPFEVYSATAALYLAMTSAFRAAFAGIAQCWFGRWRA